MLEIILQPGQQKVVQAPDISQAYRWSRHSTAFLFYK
jgi:hypothetical protein